MQFPFFFFFSRPKWEGGQYDGDEHSRLEALHLAEELGADYIDIELKVMLRYSYIYSYYPTDYRRFMLSLPINLGTM